MSNAPSDLTLWPEFHNGVAAGLRLHPGSKISRSWILYNKTQAMKDCKDGHSVSHAGVLLGLGTSHTAQSRLPTNG